MVADLRWKLGLSQAELGRMAGVSKQSISDIERGVWGTKLIKAQRIAAALNVTVQDLEPREEDTAA